MFFFYLSLPTIPSILGSVLELEALKDNLFFVVDKRSDVKTFTEENISVRVPLANKRRCLIADTKTQQHPTYSQSV